MSGSSSPLRVALFLTGTSLLLGCGTIVLAQTPTALDQQTTRLDGTADGSEVESFSHSDLPAGDFLSTDSNGRSRSQALDNARVDPGILLFVDPSEAPEMPVVEPPENIDPAILWQPEHSSEEERSEDP